MEFKWHPEKAQGRAGRRICHRRGQDSLHAGLLRWLALRYHYGFTNARKHLQELGAGEPQLPPFDESKFEPMPDVELNPKDEFWVDPDKLDSS